MHSVKDVTNIKDSPCGRSFGHYEQWPVLSGWSESQQENTYSRDREILHTVNLRNEEMSKAHPWYQGFISKFNTMVKYCMPVIVLWRCRHIGFGRYANPDIGP